MQAANMFLVSLLIVLAKGLATPFSLADGVRRGLFEGQHAKYGLASPEREVYVGGMLGVSARVVLCRKRENAQITLSGIPVGGTVSGTARFGRGSEEKVVVGEPLAGTLRRRFVRIVEAEHKEASDTVVVVARLPLVLGTQTIVLVRASDRDSKLSAEESKRCA
jgi:hypothetical protein